MKTQASQNSNCLRVIVYEHVSGGGYANRPLPPSVLAEGFGMLRSFVDDLKAVGHEVTVLIDERLSKLNTPLDADCTIPIFYPEEPIRFITDIAKVNDAIYVIAPETGQTLQAMVDLAEQTGKISLNCKSSAIGKVADKEALYEGLQDKGFPTPKTLALDVNCRLTEIMQTLKNDFNFPVVFKPVDGVGCSGLSIVKNEKQIQPALAKIKQVSASKRFIIQEFINGDSASVSLLSNGKKASALSLNRQSVVLADSGSESSYEGGCVPFDHPLREDAVVLTQKVVESYPGLRGYVGVDVILTQNEVFVVDVNPRLTTSYVGLRKIAGFNVAEALVNAVVTGKLPNKLVSQGVACFSKIETSITSNTFQQVAILSDVVSPPFPLGNTKSYALVIGEGKKIDAAKLHLEEAKKNLDKILC